MVSRLDVSMEEIAGRKIKIAVKAKIRHRTAKYHMHGIGVAEMSFARQCFCERVGNRISSRNIME